MSRVAYQINDMYATIQGEGALTGTPMVLIRTHGCPVGCTFCDTKHTWGGREPLKNDDGTVRSLREAANRQHFTEFERDVWADGATPTADPVHPWRGDTPEWCEASAQQVAALAREMAPDLDWILLTGGEPCVQDLRELRPALRREGFKIALETSGTAHGHVFPSDPVDFFSWVTVSPKLDNPAGLPILNDVIFAADEIKFVIGRQSDIDRMDAALAGWSDADCLRVKTRISLQPMSASIAATALCVEYCLRTGSSLSLQTHKTMGVR